MAFRKHSGSSARSARRSAASARSRSVALKICACAVLIGICAFGAFMIGDADYHASMIGWVPLITVVGAIVLAFLYLLFMRNGLSISESSASGSCQKGEEVVISTEFVNRRPLFYFCIQALLYISDTEGRPLTRTETTLALSPFARYSMGFTVRFDHVGTYSAGIYEVTICDFLRLFTHRIACKRKTEVQVTPRVVPIKRIAFSNDAALETSRAHKATLADSLDYAMVREYVPGDPLKTIHWKISARSENYMTRLFEVYNNPGAAIVMDFFAPSDDTETLMSMFDAVVESGFSLAAYSREQGMDTELHYVNRHGERCRRLSWNGIEAADIVEELPRMTKDAVHAQESLELVRSLVLSQNGQNNLIVCTADLSADMITLLIEAKARKRNPVLVAVVPSGLVGREREMYCSGLGRLSSANIGYIAIGSADELGEASV